MGVLNMLRPITVHSSPGNRQVVRVSGVSYITDITLVKHALILISL